jgi:hypothetical protein
MARTSRTKVKLAGFTSWGCGGICAHDLAGSLDVSAVEFSAIAANWRFGLGHAQAAQRARPRGSCGVHQLEHGALAEGMEITLVYAVPLRTTSSRLVAGCAVC